MWCIQNRSCENDQFIPMHCPNKLPDMVVVTLFLVTDGQASPWSLRHYMAIYCLYMASGALEQNTGVYGCLGLVIPLRLVWQLEHLRCKQTAWGTFSWGKNAFSFFCPNVPTHFLAHFQQVHFWSINESISSKMLIIWTKNFFFLGCNYSIFSPKLIFKS